MRIDMLGVAIFPVGSVCNDHIWLKFLDVFSDRPGKIRQGDIDPARDAVDFHIRINIR